MSFFVILNEFRRPFVWKLMSGNTLELDTGVYWKAKNELTGLGFSLKSDIT